MDIILSPGTLRGTVRAIPSKSQAHRLLICAAFARSETRLLCPQTNRDIEATVDCLNALGARILRTPEGYQVSPVRGIPENAVLRCGESGSTLRFLLPVVGALGVNALFLLEGRLPRRPLSPLWEEMERMGCHLSRPSENTVRCTGRLQSGTYRIPGNISSQYVTGLLFALALLEGDSRIEVSGTLESGPYVDMTCHALKAFGVEVRDLCVAGGQVFRSPGSLAVEGDWSNAAFFLAAAALGSDVTVTGLDPESPQGDRAAAWLLPALREKRIVSAADIPDLVPILAVVAAANAGAVFTQVHRLRLKESDRVASVIALLEGLGGRAEADENTLTVYGTGLTGGTVDSVNDHRIAMATAIASTVCREKVTVLEAQCVNKSYPGFWEEFAALGGNYEQYLR